MHHIDVKFLRAAALMIGSILGVGVFGLPFLFVRSGLAAGLAALVALGFVVGVLNLMYGEIVLRTPGSYRMGGYVAAYLGRGWGTLASLVFAAAVVGSLVAFLIVGAQFFHDLFAPAIGGSLPAYAFALALVVAIASFNGARLVSKIEWPVVVILLFLFTLLILAALPHVSVGHLLGDPATLADIPFGAVLFTLSGGGIIPDMRDVLGRRARQLLPLAITFGMAAVIAIDAAFSLVVVGVNGPAATPVAFEGLIPVLGPAFALLMLLLGSVVVFSISLSNVIQLADTLQMDHALPPRASWAIASAAAFALYLAGARDFIGVIGFVGAVLGGTVGLFILFTYERMKRDTSCVHAHCLEVPTFASVLIGLTFVGAMVLELLK
jgi:amino acid permease